MGCNLAATHLGMAGVSDGLKVLGAEGIPVA
jgi:hypothetical protein